MGDVELSEEDKSSSQNFKKIHVVAEDCTSCSLCYESLPQTFKDRGDGISFVHSAEAEATVEEKQTAMDECPGECIHWGPEDNPS